MAYYFYLGNVLLPIPPSKLELKISNNNKTYNLINYSQINVLKNPGLSSLEFEVVLPNILLQCIKTIFKMPNII
jgi:hypothetical protein